MISCFKSMADELNEGEFLTELSQRLAHSTKRIRVISDGKLMTEFNDPWRPDYEDTYTSWNIATSLQSTLCNPMGGYHSNQASPPCEEAMNKNMEATELLYAAAEEVTRLQQHTGTAFFHFCAPPQKPCINQQFKPQQSMKKKQKGYVQYMQQAQQDETGNGNSRAPGLPPSAWPTLKKSQLYKQPISAGSGMKAVILGNQDTKSERSGTGVFLPRQAGSWNKPSPQIACKKPGYSRVQLPERVVQALNLNLGAMETPHQLHKNGFSHQQYDAALKHRESGVSAHAEQRWDMARSTVTNNELQLPQEWTY